MPAAPSLVLQPISYIQTLTGGGMVRREGHVFCVRRGETLPTSLCARCPRFIKVVAGEGKVSDAVCCQVGEPLEPRRVPGSLEPQRDSGVHGTLLELPRLPVSALMTRDVVCVRPDLTLDAAVALFVERSLEVLPVVTDEGKFCGFVSQTEVMLEIQAARELPEDRPRTVGDVLMPYALALPETASITRAAALMALEGQQRLMVLSRDDLVVGMLSAADILHWLASADGKTGT